MNGGTEEPETTRTETGGDPVIVDQTPGDVPATGQIVGGTWVNPNVPRGARQQGAATRISSYTLPEGRTSVMRTIFGGVVILTDELSEWASLSDEEDLPQQMTEAAIRQALQEQERLADRPYADLRYGFIGLLGGALEAAQNGTVRLSSLSDKAARAAGRVIAPVWNSFLLEPLHTPLLRVEKAGAEKVDEWIERGRIEEVRSRAVAEVGINNFVSESVTEITANAQVQMLVQQVIASQSTGMLTQILDEIRERFVSLDLVLLQKLHQTLEPSPDFRGQYLDALAERQPRYQRAALNRSLAGTYAGPLSRLAAFVIDLIILIFAVGLISSLISSSLALFGLTDLVVSFLVSGSPVANLLLIFILLSNFLLIGLYFVFSWNVIGATPGELIFGLRVVGNHGDKISFWRANVRLFGVLISALALFLGFIWAIFDSRCQGWHDKLAATLVLYDWPAQPDERFLHNILTDGSEQGAAGQGL